MAWHLTRRPSEARSSRIWTEQEGRAGQAVALGSECLAEELSEAESRETENAASSQQAWKSPSIQADADLIKEA